MRCYFVLAYLVLRLTPDLKAPGHTSAVCKAPINYEQSSPLILDAVKKLMECCHEMNVWLKHHTSLMWFQVSFVGFFKTVQGMLFSVSIKGESHSVPAPTCFRAFEVCVENPVFCDANGNG